MNGMQQAPDFIQLPPDSPSADGGRHGTLSRDHYGRYGRERDRDRDHDRDRERDNRDRDRHSRRRSRSPGRPRRDFEVDSYSSSRGYREREREDRYAGRDRRDDRDWERDRGPRRERREDDRPRRADRDPYDDRRRARDRDDTRRESSPARPQKAREPTPDLTSIVSVLERPRRMTQWDMKPAGYENVTAEQAKLSGMFPLPGAPRQAAIDPTRMQALLNQPAGATNASTLRPTNARQSKRLIVSNLPPPVTEEGLTAFFNLQMNNLNVVRGHDPCVASKFARDGSYAVVEFKLPEDATVALAFDGITMEEHGSMDASNGTANGTPAGLSIRRPKDYIVPHVTEDTDMEFTGETSRDIKDSQNKLMISSLPDALSDTQVQELLAAFGAMKSFVLVKDRDTEQSRGIAFCEYVDPSYTSTAIEGLNGLDVGDSRLKVQHACIGLQQAEIDLSTGAITMLAGATSTDSEKSRVLCLMNMVTVEDLTDSVEYEEIYDDVRSECAKYGKILELKIPRPAGARSSPGVGKIFIKYDKVESAQKALSALAGRKFADRTVVAAYFGEEYFDVDAW